MKRPLLNKQERWYLNYQPKSTYACFLKLFLARRLFLRALQRAFTGWYKKEKND